ncbi:MAG TPA: N-acetylglucosamine-6-phosphate deacetylase [Polyangia bacterium]|jgi:N-acetylglucosamine-6-phosphate deacetylase|nr:N-acetylglucosamine-6-phosphate deacetylase [Polyangia bacterium]
MKTESAHGHNRYSVTGRLLLDGRLVPGALVVEGERIVEVRTDAVGELPGPRLDADLVSPGLIDLQCNGGFGLEVGGDAAALRALAARLPSTGVTTFLPTVVSALPAHYRAVAAALAAFEFGVESAAPRAQAAGLHLEGPLLSRSRAGAHDRAAIAAADDTLADILDELLGSRALRLMTLAPERPGALALSRRLLEADVVVSLGHTDATYDEMLDGSDAGATLATHLFSAMSPFHHRAPGAVGAALIDERLTVSLIADGVHAHPAALNLVLRAKGAERIVLVTDAVAAAGAPAGTYGLVGAPIVSDGESARLADGTLAGSTLTLDRAVRTMVALGGARVEEALTMATAVPAARLGLLDRGRLAVGRRADLALWSAELEIVSTAVGGVWNRPPV